MQIRMMPEPMVLSMSLSKLLWDRATARLVEKSDARVLTFEDDLDYITGLKDAGMGEAGLVLSWLIGYKKIELAIMPLDGEDDDWK